MDPLHVVQQLTNTRGAAATPRGPSGAQQEAEQFCCCAFSSRLVSSVRPSSSSRGRCGFNCLTLSPPEASFYRVSFTVDDGSSALTQAGVEEAVTLWVRTRLSVT